MSETRRFDDLTTTVARTQQALDDKTTTLASRLAGHTHLAESGPSTSTPVAGYRLNNDTKNRLTILADGTLAWADGTAEPDVFLSRSAANRLEVPASDFLYANGREVNESTVYASHSGNGETTAPSGATSAVFLGLPQTNHSLVTRSVEGNGHKFTLGRAGVWEFVATVRFNAGGSSAYTAAQIGIVGGSVLSISATTTNTICVQNVVATTRLNAGDAVALYTYHERGQAITTPDLASNGYRRLTLRWVGP